MSKSHHYQAVPGVANEEDTPPRPQSSSRHVPHDSNSSAISTPVVLSRPQSRNPSPLPSTAPRTPQPASRRYDGEEFGEHSRYGHASSSALFDADEEEDEDVATEMPSDLRPPYRRASNGRSHDPLLNELAKAEPVYDTPTHQRSASAKSTFRQRDPEEEAKRATRKRYLYAAFFLVVSLVSFVVQTETAHYITAILGWKKSYAMLYFTHGSWSVLWFLQLIAQRIQQWHMPWGQFWRRHFELLYSTAQMVQHQDILAPSRYHGSPVPYMLKTLAFVACALTIAGGSWYVAVVLTTSSDLTAIYNCSAFFAYVFSVPMLKEQFRWSKTVAVGIAVLGVLVVAYGDSSTPKHTSHSGGGAGGPGSEEGDKDKPNRLLGNIVIAIGSVLYGFYEVLYKKYACPPEGTSAGRSMIFANLFGSMIGFFTLTVLWIPIPILHYTGIETFEMPTGEASWMLAISTLSNAIFSGSFLVLISLTSPVLSSVAALLTIFLVALVDVLLPPPMYNELSAAAIIGGTLIIFAFILLSWFTYREMDEERRKKADAEVEESDIEPDDD